MKALGLLTMASFLLVLTAANGQLPTARQLTRKIVPPPAPATQPAPPPAAAPSQPAVAPAPVDTEQEKAKQAETLKKTIAFQKKRAEDGSASAQYELAVRYLKGDGLDKDVETGRKWLEKSAAQDYSLAKRKLEELNAEKKP